MKKMNEKTKQSKNIFEYFDEPRLWEYNHDEVASRLPKEDVDWIEAQPFDWGDIMCACGYFLTKEQVASYLFTDYGALDRYCKLMFGVPWTELYNNCYWRAQGVGRDIIERHAKDGHSTAMSIMSKSLMKLDEEEQSKSLRVTIVNDLNED